MRIEKKLPAYLHRVVQVMKKHPLILDAHVEVANLPPKPGFVDIVVNVVGFIALNDGQSKEYREAIHACDKQDIQTHNSHISIETNYLGAFGRSAQRIAVANHVKLFTEGGCGDFGVTLPSNSSKKQIREAFDRLIAAIVAFRTNLNGKYVSIDRIC